MKKILITVFSLFSILLCKAQTTIVKQFSYQNFEHEILTYVPEQRTGVSDQNFKKAQLYLKETKENTKSDPKNLNEADFWNITMAFINLKEPKSNIEIAFKKAINLNSATICSYVKTLGNAGLDLLIPETFLAFETQCKLTAAGKIDEKKFDILQYAKVNNVNPTLVAIIRQLELNDVRYRNDKTIDWEKQNLLDLQNQKQIDSLYKLYKTYIGKSLVGKELQNIMWLVVQHSNLSMMEKYLPILHTAFVEKELEANHLKMLIDRIYSIKYHYQIFGSQVNVSIADEKKKSEVKLKYGIE